MAAVAAAAAAAAAAAVNAMKRMLLPNKLKVRGAQFMTYVERDRDRQLRREKKK